MSLLLVHHWPSGRWWAVLEADVVQERRAVWEWVLEPVLALRQKVSFAASEPT